MEKRIEEFLEKYPNSEESKQVKRILTNVKQNLRNKTTGKKFKWIIVFSNTSKVILKIERKYDLRTK